MLLVALLFSEIKGEGGKVGEELLRQGRYGERAAPFHACGCVRRLKQEQYFGDGKKAQWRRDGTSQFLFWNKEINR